jgi:hypothetical protein
MSGGCGGQLFREMPSQKQGGKQVDGEVFAAVWFIDVGQWPIFEDGRTVDQDTDLPKLCSGGENGPGCRSRVLEVSLHGGGCDAGSAQFVHQLSGSGV